MKWYYFAITLVFNIHFLHTSIYDKNNIFKYGPEELITEITHRLCHHVKLNEIKEIVEKRTINTPFNKLICGTSWYVELYKKRVIQDVRYACFDETRVINSAKYQNIYGEHIFNWFPDLNHISSIHAKNVTYYTEELDVSQLFTTLVIKEHNPDKILGIRVIIGTNRVADENYTSFDNVPTKYPIMLDFSSSGNYPLNIILNIVNYFRERNIKINAIKFPETFFYTRNTFLGDFSEMLNNLIKNYHIPVFLFHYNYIIAVSNHLSNPCIGFYGYPHFPLGYPLHPNQAKIFTYFIKNGLIAHVIELIASSGQLQLLPVLKKYGANFNQVSSKYKPILCYAFHNLEALKKLIQVGADCNAKNFQGETALSEAIKQLISVHEKNEGRFHKNFQKNCTTVTQRCYKVITMLFENGAKPISCPSLKQKVLDKLQKNPIAELFDAVKNNHYDKVIFLLAIGTKVNGKNEYDRSLLCYVKSARILNILIKNGLKIDNTKINEVINYLKKARGIESRNKRINLLREYFKNK